MDDFRRLLSRLGSNPEMAGKAYNNLHRRLAKYFEWNNCRFAENSADEVFRRVENKLRQIEEKPLETEQIEDVPKYAFGIAKYVLKECIREEFRETELDPDGEGHPHLALPSSESEIIARIDKMKWLGHLQECLGELSQPDRNLILGYYGGETQKPKDHRRQLAEKMEVTDGVLRTRANRIRDLLEDCVLRKMRLRALTRRFSENTTS